MKIKVVWTMHNLFPHDSKQIQINKYVQNFFIKQCNWIRVFSKSTIPKVIKEFKSANGKTIAVPEGSYVNYYPDNITRNEAREKMGFNKEKIFLYLGTIKPYKGIINLINVFSKIDNQDVKLIIAGKVMNSNYLNKINKNIKNNNNIKLVNKFINPDELQLFFKSADAVILPFSNIENSGSTILAMGFKKVIIAPNIGVLPDRLKNQIDFLYNNDLLGKINKVIATDIPELKKKGEMNFNELKKNTWYDFSRCFIDNKI